MSLQQVFEMTAISRSAPWTSLCQIYVNSEQEKLLIVKDFPRLFGAVKNNFWKSIGPILKCPAHLLACY